MFSVSDLPLARVELMSGPTPVQRVTEDLWVKREDRAGSLYGGNKVRKLEYLLGDALESGGDVLTMGAIGSHHVLATAVYGKQAGVRVHGVLFPQPDSPHARENARAIHAWCEQVWVAHSRAELPVAWAKARLALRSFGGFPPVTVPMGGSNALGCVGWIAGGLEIAAQVASGELPLPERVVVPLGSGGTVVGLTLGLRAAGLATEVVAVRVVPAVTAHTLSLRLLAGRTLARVRPLGFPEVGLTGVRVVGRQYGGGYGVPSRGGEAAIETARAWGLELDSTYAGKALAEALDDRGPHTLFVDTVSSRPMAPLLATALDEVPETLRGLLTRPAGPPRA